MPCVSRVVNVSFPNKPRGLAWTRVSVRRYEGQIVPTTDPLGRDYFWFSAVPIQDVEDGTDRWAVEQEWISMTPLRFDLTDEERLRDGCKNHPLEASLGEGERGQ